MKFTSFKWFYFVLVCVFVQLFTLQLFGQTTLNVWQFSIDEVLSKKIVKDFESSHPEIKINMQQLSWDYGHDKIVTSLIAGNAPDVFEIGSTWGPKFSQSGILKNLTAQTKPLKDKYLMWDPVTYENNVFGVPWLVGTRFILYNKDLFRQAGLDPNHSPKTWSELRYVAESISKLDKDIYGYGIAVAEDFSPWQTFLPYLWNSGASVLSADFKSASLEHRGVYNALNYYKGLKAFSLVDRQKQIDQLFAAGKVGVIFSGAWNFKSIEKVNSRLDYGVSVVPTPDDHQDPISFGGGEMLVILEKSKHPNEAFEFIKYLTSYEVELAISKSQKNVLPSLKKALDDPFFQSDARFQGFAKQMRYTKTPPAHIAWLNIGKDLSTMIDQIILQDADIEKTVQTTSASINLRLKQKNKTKYISDERLTLWILIILVFLFCILWMFRNQSQPFGQLSTWIFVSPWVILFFVFSLYPLLYALVISFSDYNILTSSFSWVGFKNYIDTLKNPDFLNAVKHTLFFAIGTIPFILLIAIGLAVIINQGVPLKAFFQAGFFLPVVTSVIVIATLFTYFYAENGMLNTFLEWLGLPRPKPSWLINENWALVSIMAMAVWASAGYYMILFLAALQGIPKELYEASRLDGASGLQQFFKITLPQLKPMVLFVVVINTINALQVFPEIFTMTKGGPSRSTTTIVYYLYEKGFSDFQMGAASAVAYLLAIMIGVFAYIQMKVLREN